MKEKFPYDSKIRKIPIIPLMAILEEILEKGATYVDIFGKTNEGKDRDEITVAVPTGYQGNTDFSPNIEHDGEIYDEVDFGEESDFDNNEEDTDIEDLLNDI